MSDRRANSKAKHRRPSAAARKGQRAVVLTVTGGMAAGGFVAGAGSAVASHTTVSQGEGYFLSGNVLDIDLKGLLPTAKAVNKSHDQSSVKEDSQLGINLGNTVGNVALPAPLNSVNLLGSNGILDAGVLNEYAKAKGDGSSLGASGAVTKTGSIEAGTPDQNATLNLSALLGGVTDAVADLDLSVGALAATAKETAGGTQTGDYKIADLVVSLQSPLLSPILGTLEGAVTGGTTTGLLNTASGLLTTLAAGGTVTGLPTSTSLNNIMDGFDTTLSGGGVAVDLATGKISINLSQIKNLNNLPKNTDLVPLIVDALTTLVPNLIDAELTKLTNAVNTAFSTSNVVVTPLVGPAIDPSLITPILNTVTAPILAAIQSAGGNQNALLSVADGPLDNILNDVLDLVANVQHTAGGIFTERALSVGLSLPTALPVVPGDVVANAVPAAGTLALVNLASASVGPNAAVALAPPVITEPDNGDETTDRTPQIEGTGVPGAKVTVRESGDTICTATVNSSGKWHCTPGSNMSLGSHTITATQSKDGRTSAKSNTVTFKIVASETALPDTGGMGGDGGSVPFAAAGLALLLGGGGLAAAPRMARHGGGSSGGSGAHARGGKHARR
jgi:hypothetical protein